MVNKTTGDFDGGMKQMSAVGGKKGCRARKQERQTRGIAALTLFRTAVPFGGQTTDNLGRLSPKGDCGSKQNGKTVDTSKGKGEDFCLALSQATSRSAHSRRNVRRRIREGNRRVGKRRAQIRLRRDGLLAIRVTERVHEGRSKYVCS